MGESLSIDERCSELEDILQVNLEQLQERSCEATDNNSNGRSISQNIKIWRFYEETTGKSKKKKKKIRSQPITLDQLQSKDFSFLPAECYVVLLVYRRNHPIALSNTDSSQILPYLSQIILQSSGNLTPRGLETPLSRSELNNVGVVTDSFLQQIQHTSNADQKQRGQCAEEKITYEHMIFVWNGKECNSLVKSLGLSSAYALESIIGQGQEKLLRELFYGRVMVSKDKQKNQETTVASVQYGVVPMSLSGKTQQINNAELDSMISKMSSSIFIVRFLCAESAGKVVQQGSKSNITDQQHSKSTDDHDIAKHDLQLLQGQQQKIDLSSQGQSQLQPERIEDQLVKVDNDNEVGEDSTQFRFFKRLFCQGIDSAPAAVQNPPPSPSSLAFQPPTSSPQDVYLTNFMRIPGTFLKNKQTSPKGSLFAKQSQEYQQQQQQQQAQMGNDNGYIDQGQDEPGQDSQGQGQQIQDPFICHEPPNDNPFGYDPSDERNGERLDTPIKIKYFAQICSAVIPELLYVSGETVAYNKEQLKSNGITHIINCAGDVCKNMYPDDFVYRVYRLKDTKTENIEAIFYETIELIEEVKRQHGRVFVHCVQGISRSVTLCIAYVIWKEKIDFQEALALVKKGRDVASPNAGFLVQLINFYKRLYQPFDSIPVKPRVWCVCSHQVEQPNLIVAKMLLEGLYSAISHMNTNKLDPRGVFIIESSEKLYLWVGSSIPADRSQIYMDYAIKYIDKLRKYEHAPNNALQIVKESQEPKEFWNMWQSVPEQPYAMVKEWDNWFLDLVDPSLPELPPQYYYDQDEHEEDQQYQQQDQQDYQNQEERNLAGDMQQNSSMKPILFIFPESSDPLTIFDYDDLTEDNLCILCRQSDGVLKVHIWRGLEFMQPLEVEQQFLDEVIQNNFAEQDVNKIFIYKENPNQESDEFSHCFQTC